MDKTSCVFTIVRNEMVFLDVWLNHYSKYFPPEDIYVINHHSNDGSVEKAKTKYKFNEILNMDESVFNTSFLNDLVKKTQVELLGRYNYVVFVEADEYIVPDPEKYTGIKDYINKLDKDFVHCYGYDILHFNKEEPRIDWNKPLLKQRKFWAHNEPYNKPSVSKVPLDWVPGFHYLNSENPQLIEEVADKDLILFHCKRIDWDTAENRWYATNVPGNSFADMFNQYNGGAKEIPKKYKNWI